MAALDAMKKLPLKRADNNWANWVSDLMSPPIVWVVVSLLMAWSFSATLWEALPWAFIYSLFVCILPVAFILYQLWVGEIGDIHLKYRHERYKPMFVTVMSNLVGWWLLHALNVPIVMEILAIMSLLEVTIISVITLYWQISMHAMAITGAIMAVAIVFSIPLGLLLTPLIVLVGAARLRLDRHTPAQVFAGAMVGALTPVILFLFATPFLYSLL